jgi:phosphoribosylaminoimidazolecarboxamide formyltransferase / IMP cyclohydrolase
MASPTIQRALISVSDKLGLAEFARGLAAAGVQIYSTGGTASYLRESGLTVHEISQYTGFPELMDGRLKTLHPKVFGGILCRHDRPDDQQALQQHEIATFELVVVNLYPFEATIARPEVTDAEAIEKIDIGGPSLVRAAAKNHAFITIATDPSQYAEILDQVTTAGATTLDFRRRLAAAAFTLTASYDEAISGYFSRQLAVDQEEFPPRVQLALERTATLRYGENPHQRAALYRLAHTSGPSLVDARQLNGKELSYNNLLDLDAALAIVRSLPGAAASVVKHNNPCGAASADTLAVATQRALDGDPVSAFGSILGFNQPVDAATAEVLSAPGLFVEAIVAPKFLPEAVEILTTRPKWRNNVRLMEVGELQHTAPEWHYRHIAGGMLLQDDDLQDDPENTWQVVTDRQPDPQLMDELKFSWAIVRHVKSNAIAVTRQRALCGAGAGQMSRVDSVEIALQKAGERAQGAVLASDAFFPFPDSIERAAAAGIAAIIQPGGSKRDDEVIAECNARGLAMMFTGRRHFKH